MELWEGAVLLVGGVVLVGYMSRKNAASLGMVAVGAPVTTVNGSGLSNTSNLTDITNKAGGYPTVWGEPLEAPQPPIVKPINAQPVATPLRPVTGIRVGVPVATPVSVPKGSLFSKLIPSAPVANPRVARPVDVHL